MDSANKNDNSKWNEESRATFNEFKRRRRNLPSPSDVDENTNFKKRKQNVFSRVTTENRRNLFDKNRDLKANHNPNELFSKKDPVLVNSTLCGSEKFLSMDVSEDELNKTEVPCDEYEQKLAAVQSMIKKRDDPYTILEKIVNDLAENHSRHKALIQKVNDDNVKRCQQLNEQQVALENEIMEKIKYVYEKNQERMNAIEISQKCGTESNILWLSFADPREIEKLRLNNRNELIREAKKIFTRMDIWMNNPLRAIVDTFIKKIAIKTGNGFENEMIMGVKFSNSNTVRELKSLVMKFAKENYLQQNLDRIRYTIRDNWSSDIWRLLRVCYDLTHFKLLKRTNVLDNGIIVYYDEIDSDSNEVQRSMLIRCESDLDDLRKAVKDVSLNIPAFEFYDGNYFKMSPSERKEHKDKSALEKVLNEEDASLD